MNWYGKHKDAQGFSWYRKKSNLMCCEEKIKVQIKKLIERDMRVNISYYYIVQNNLLSASLTIQILINVYW